MPRTRNPYPTEFREQLVALARAGRSVESLARICAAEGVDHVRHPLLAGALEIARFWPSSVGKLAIPDTLKTGMNTPCQIVTEKTRVTK